VEVSPEVLGIDQHYSKALAVPLGEFVVGSHQSPLVIIGLADAQLLFSAAL
jgi:hypothetical protein